MLKSVSRVIRIVELLSQKPSMTLTDIAASLQMDKATVYRALATLENHGWVTQDSASRQYRLSLKIAALGSRILHNLPWQNLATPYLRELTRQTQESANLAVLDGSEVVYIGREPSQHSLRIVSKIGERLPSYCTAVGKVLLAYLPETRREQIVSSMDLRARTANTITDATRLREHLADVATQGYAIDNMENSLDVLCIAAPLYGPGGDVSTAIGISGPANRMSDNGIIDEHIQAVKNVADEMSQELTSFMQGEILP
jgi:IclR family KDG regulon transcriptional repressor